MEQANTWANELISSSLLLKGNSNEKVKIHGLVRASTIAFIDKGKECMTLVESIPRWMCKETFTKFTSISLMSGHDVSRLSRLNAPLLEILLLRGDVSSTTLDSDFFQGMKILKVLSLSNVNFDTGLPESIGDLERLQTLNLYCCELRDVKLIGKLVNLLVLSLCGSTLENLAIEIGELSNLRLLDLRWCGSLSRIQANILSRLSNLEGLYLEDSKVESSQASGSELDTLSHLNVLEMDVSNIEQLLNNSQLIEQLGKFRILGQYSNKWSYARYIEDLQFRYVLDLGDIHVNQNSGLRALLKKTECLTLRNSDGFNSLVPELETDGFKDLKYLKVRECKQLKSIIRSKEENKAMSAFANLEDLEVDSLSSLDMICDGKAPPGLFSNLCRLNLSNLHELKHGLPLTTGAFNLSEVSIRKCGTLKSIAYKAAFAAEDIESDLDLFPCLKSLVLRSVSCLASVVDRSEITDEVYNLFNAESKYPSLENLNLSGNSEIKTLWGPTCYISGFTKLKTLKIVNCKASQSLGPPPIFAALVQLEKLKIENCSSLQEVVSKETEENGILEEKSIIFPKLKSISLEDSLKIERFCRGSYNLSFPNLESLHLISLDSFTNFDGSELIEDDDDAAPLCEHLTYIRLEDIPKLKMLSFPLFKSIVSLYITKLSWKYVFPADLFIKGNEQLQLLERLYIQDCENLQVIIKDELVGDGEERVYSLPRLAHLELHSLNITKFASKPDSEVHFPSLKGIILDSCNNKESFWSGSFRAPKLKYVMVLECDNIQCFLSGNRTEVPELPSLEEVEIMQCPGMLSFLSVPLIAPKLRSATLEDCSTMKWFLHGDPNNNDIVKLPSLETVEITRCNEMQSFSSGGIEAPTLQKLEVDEKVFHEPPNELQSMLANLPMYFKSSENVAMDGRMPSFDENEGSDEESDKKEVMKNEQEIPQV